MSDISEDCQGVIFTQKGQFNRCRIGKNRVSTKHPAIDVPYTAFRRLEREPGFSRTPFYNAMFLLLFKAGGPSGVRTRVFAVRGRCPSPLDDGTKLAEEQGFEP